MNTGLCKQEGTFPMCTLENASRKGKIFIARLCLPTTLENLAAQHEHRIAIIIKTIFWPSISMIYSIEVKLIIMLIFQLFSFVVFLNYPIYLALSISFPLYGEWVNQNSLICCSLRHWHEELLLSQWNGNSRIGHLLFTGRVQRRAWNKFLLKIINIRNCLTSSLASVSQSVIFQGYKCYVFYLTTSPIFCHLFAGKNMRKMF